jgi:hypothetical protein
MNAATRTRLKIMVERAVRPVPASAARKRNMREELLAHVTAAFEEEVARAGDERAALGRTEQRFGDPGELASQLQQSVPARDFSERLMRRVLLLTACWLVLFGAAEFPTFPGRTLLDVCLFGVGIIFLTDVVRRALDRPAGRPRRRAVLLAGSSLLLFLALLLLTLEFPLDGWPRLGPISHVFMLTAVLTWGLVAPVYNTVASFRAQAEWESLPIE